MDTPKDWSKLCPDILRKILETLSLNPIDSHRAKIVCSYWYSVWKTSLNRPRCPLRIIHRGDSLNHPRKDKRCDKKKLFRLTKESYCMASSGNWLLMVDSRLDFHLLNMLTRKRINIPRRNSPIRCQHVMSYGCFVGPSPKDDVLKGIFGCKKPAVVWINERTRDYFVAWIFKQDQLFTYKKGYDSWWNLNQEGANSGFLDLAYKNSKLYMFTTDYHIRIIDFSGNSPKEEETENPYRNHPFDFVEQPWEYIWKRKIAIQKSGEVLIILSLQEAKYEKRLLFYIFKMNLESYKWIRVDSIGDEMLIFGHGVTVSASLKDFGGGIKSDSIYFVDDDVWPDHQDHDVRASNCGVFDIATSGIKWPKRSCFYINKTQWFVRGVYY